MNTLCAANHHIHADFQRFCLQISLQKKREADGKLYNCFSRFYLSKLHFVYSFEVTADSPLYRGIRWRALAAIDVIKGEEMLAHLLCNNRNK